MRIFFLFATLLLFFLNIRCDFQKTPTTPTGNQTFTIRTTFYPLTEFTQRLVGSSAKVECLLPAGEDPIFWKPSSEVIQKYQESDLIVINGASFEQWVSTASLPSKKLVDTAKSFKEQWVENAQTHSHGKQGEHSHTGVDGHTWVSPAFALQQVDTLKEALIKALPEKKETFEKNYLALKKDLEALDASCKAIAEKASGKYLVASHPAYNYLKVSYGFSIKNFDFDPEELPSEKSLQELLDYTQKHPVTFMLWEAQPSPEVEKFFLEKTGLKAVEFSPVENLEGLDQKTTFFSIMKENLARFEKALKP